MTHDQSFWLLILLAVQTFLLFLLTAGCLAIGDALRAIHRRLDRIPKPMLDLTENRMDQECLSYRCPNKFRRLADKKVSDKLLRKDRGEAAGHRHLWRHRFGQDNHH